MSPFAMGAISHGFPPEARSGQSPVHTRRRSEESVPIGARGRTRGTARQRVSTVTGGTANLLLVDGTADLVTVRGVARVLLAHPGAGRAVGRAARRVVGISRSRKLAALGGGVVVAAVGVPREPVGRVFEHI